MITNRQENSGLPDAARHRPIPLTAKEVRQLRWLLFWLFLFTWWVAPNPAFPAVLLIFGVVAIEILKRSRKKTAIEFLRAKYAGLPMLELILQHKFWIGQTADQLIDSIGKPHGIDRKMVKTIQREIWKYGHRGSGRYRLRITLDDGKVVAWDDKT